MKKKEGRRATSEEGLLGVGAHLPAAPFEVAPLWLQAPGAGGGRAGRCGARVRATRSALARKRRADGRFLSAPLSFFPPHKKTHRVRLERGRHLQVAALDGHAHGGRTLGGGGSDGAARRRGDRRGVHGRDPDGRGAGGAGRARRASGREDGARGQGAEHG